MRVQDIGVSTAIMLALLVLGCWWYSASGHPPGPFGIFTWAIFLVGAILAFSIGGSILALPFLWLTREKGIEALHHYTQLKCVTIRL